LYIAAFFTGYYSQLLIDKTADFDYLTQTENSRCRSSSACAAIAGMRTARDHRQPALLSGGNDPKWSSGWTSSGWLATGLTVFYSAAAPPYPGWIRFLKYMVFLDLAFLTR
jgi:hypothetical protein